MTMDAALVRTLRGERSWSQEHLAAAAGISVRTVQRVEAEGVGSAETRLALAAALDVPVARLSPVRARALSAGYRRGRFWGWLGLAVGGVGAAAGIISGAVHGNMSGAQLGMSAGLTGALLGMCAAALGHAQYRLGASDRDGQPG